MIELYTSSMLVAIATFTLSSVMTPGPNNIMLLSSGLTFGYKKTIPHMIGIIIGFPLMVVLVGLGIGVVFERYPQLFEVVKYAGAFYMFYLAYKIATNTTKYDKSTKSRALTFWQSAVFQWVNPKAWVMAISSTTIFVNDIEHSFSQVLMIAFIYLLSGIVSTNSWALGGVAMQKLLTNDKYIKIFNTTMAMLLCLSVLTFL